MTERIDHGGWDDEADSLPAPPLTRIQAQALRDKEPVVSVWRVVWAQAGAGVVVAGLCWALGGRSELGGSALYGAAVVVLPAAVLARAVGRGGGPMAGAIGFLGWQGVKMALTVALLLGAMKVVPNLSWPALLVAVAVCLQVNWLALLWRGRRAKE